MLDIFVNRRDFLRIGAVAGLGLTLPRVLAAQSATNRAAARARSVILVYLGGGLSHHDSFDLKPQGPEEIRGIYRPIATSVPGLQIGELLPRMARVMHKVALVRSGAHNNDHHETATNWVLSGRFGSPFGDYPAIGAVVAHQLGFRGRLPPYVAIPRNPSFTWELGKSAFLGGRYESFKAGDPNQPGYKVQDLTAEPLAAKKAERRETLLQAVDGLARTVHGNDQVATYDEFHRRAAALPFFGAGATPGFVLGKTDKRGAYTTQRPVAPADVAYTILDALGIDPHKQLLAPDGRPIEVLDQGEPVREIFA